MKTTAAPLGLSFCHAKLPKCGLGNKLFVWARALSFARKNHLPLVVTGWIDFQLAPIVRGGGTRIYWNYFHKIREVGLLNRLVLRCRSRVVKDPPLGLVNAVDAPVIYEFTRLPPWQEYFQELKPHRDLIRHDLLKLLTPVRRREYDQASKPVIAVQVRMGDFRGLKPGEDFARVGGVRTPLAYFADMINGIRLVHGSDLPVTVFSDAQPDELRELMALPAVHMSEQQTAIVDLMLMASSRVLVTSAGSTFGYWGGFLGDCALLIHPDHVHKSIRPDTVNQRFYEGLATGPAAHWPELLKSNIESIRSSTPRSADERY